MRNKKNIPRLIQQFLKSSPRSSAQRRNAILPPQYHNKLQRLPTDQQYIKNFIVHIDCTYMYNYYGPPTTSEQKFYLHKKSFVNPMSAGLVRRKAIEINDKTVEKKQMLFELIKCLNKDKQTILRYTEMQQFLMRLTLQQTRSYKKIIVYLYKWLLNQKHNFQEHSIQQQLCQQLSQLVIKKIYESHEKGDYELLKNTEEELVLIENLEKAREMKKGGRLEEAKETYQLVYFGRVTDEADRMEALEFICDRCKEEKDLKMLERMVARIKDGQGIRVHEKTLTRAINQIQQALKTSPTQDNPLVNPLMVESVSESKQTVEKMRSLFDQESVIRKRGSRKVKGFVGLKDEDEMV